jgi:hypothetical protein
VKAIAYLGALLLATSTAMAAPAIATRAPAPIAKPRHDGAHARVEVAKAGVMRPAREAVGRREEALSPEEDTAACSSPMRAPAIRCSRSTPTIRSTPRRT